MYHLLYVMYYILYTLCIYIIYTGRPEAPRVLHRHVLLAFQLALVVLAPVAEAARHLRERGKRIIRNNCAVFPMCC